ncbi:MAG: ATP-binding protein [Clostridia bacterium]|nr:ATP-binding protein [Clostridia bacterium]
MAFDAELIAEIETEYEELRQNNAIDLQNRKRAVFLKVPELEKIDYEIKSLGLKLYKIALSGNDLKKQVDELREQQKKLLTVKKALLVENGYSPDELSERYHCNICKDTGSVDAKPCTCYKKRLIEKAYEQSNLSAQLTHQSFDTFDMSLYSEKVDEKYGVSPKEHMKRIVDICKEFVRGFKETETNLLFWGEPGLGKTFLSTCIAKELIAKNHSVIYETAYKTFSMLEELKFKRNDSIDKLKFKVDKLYSCDLLILDDLGSEFLTQYTTAAFFDIINSRLISGKKTVINTNLSIEELKKKYGERVISRLYGHFRVIQFIGSDIRIDKSVNN